MNFNIYFLYCIVIIFKPINPLSYHRYRRQISPFQNNNPSLNFQSIPDIVYYGTGFNRNYGSYIFKPNRPFGNGIIPINYDPNYVNNPNYRNHNAWQNLYTNNINRFYNRYEPGNQEWYQTGGDYWFNHGSSLVVHPCFLLIIIIIFIYINRENID